MKFLAVYHTDKGIKKDTNQDSLCLKVVNTKIGSIAMAVVCDGMGGFQRGELASATVVRAFSNWFDTELNGMIDDISYEKVRDRWDSIVRKQNEKIVEYGKKNNITLGTTITAMLIVDDKFMIVLNVGDTRAYEIKDEVRKMTEDQSIVQLEVNKGIITEEEAETDPRNNILLQSVGVTEKLEPVFTCEKVKANCMYMLCSDGFRHKIKKDEMKLYFDPSNNSDTTKMKKNAIKVVELNKIRRETDNITVVLVRTLMREA